MNGCKWTISLELKNITWLPIYIYIYIYISVRAVLVSPGNHNCRDYRSGFPYAVVVSRVEFAPRCSTDNTAGAFLILKPGKGSVVHSTSVGGGCNGKIPWISRFFINITCQFFANLSNIRILKGLGAYAHTPPTHFMYAIWGGGVQNLKSARPSFPLDIFL